MTDSLWLFIIEEFIWLYLLIPLFIILSFYFTAKLGFVQFRFVREIGRSLFEKAPSSLGITAFQAFNLSMASRIGAGNVIGVAFAISLGGPGSVFWMWVLAFLGMAIAFIENTLSQIYKVKIGNHFQGGPVYYIRHGLKSPKVASCVALCLIVVFGLFFNAIQSNTIISTINATYSISAELVMIVVIVISGIIIWGGVRRIAHLTEIIVPFMMLFYLAIMGYILAFNLDMIPSLLKLIVSDAFGSSEFAGGLLGVAITEGVRNSILSNETGVGSASIAGAAANSRHPVKQGLVQSFGVFIDTMIISSASAFVILLSGLYSQDISNGILLVQASMSVHIGSLAPYFLSVVLLLFSITSIISNYYYGETNVTYFSRKNRYLYLYRLSVIAAMLLGFVVDDMFVWQIIFVLLGIIGTINLICLFLLRNIAFKAWKNYLEQRRAGEIPRFYASDIPELEGVECWKGEREKTDKRTIIDPYFQSEG